MNEPTITDWISSIGVLIGVPTAIWGIIKLFIKNKSLERQLGALEKMAEAQNLISQQMLGQIMELSKQTSEFQFQTDIMREANELSQMHYELANTQYLESKAITKKQLDLQSAERLSKIKPHFTISNGDSDPSSFEINLLNKGNIASNIEIESVDSEFAKFTKVKGFDDIDNNKKLTLRGQANPEKTFYNANLVPFEIEIRYSDQDGNKYSQKLTRRHQRYSITSPSQVSG